MAESTVVWTVTAVRQRRQILKYWTQKTGSTIYAEKLIKKISKRVKTIVRYPESWKLTNYSDTRISAMEHYSILYKIANNSIIITAFWDNRQDPKKLLDAVST